VSGEAAVPAERSRKYNPNQPSVTSSFGYRLEACSQMARRRCFTSVIVSSGPASLLKNERRSSTGIQHDDENAFVAARKARDATLAAPRRLLPSLQVNIRGGRLPPADKDGVVRFRIPITEAS